MAPNEFMKQLGFTEVENGNLDSLKVSKAHYTFDESHNIKLAGSDKRFYHQPDAWGWHMEDPDFDDDDWQALCKQYASDLHNKLQVLYLSGTGITEIELKDFTNLQFVYLSGNPLLKEVHIQIPKEKSSQLQVLDIASCSSMSLLSLSGEFPQLKRINASKGKLEQLNIKEAVLNGLKYLILFGNPEVKIEGIDRVTAIERLFVDDMNEKWAAMNKMEGEILRKELKKHFKLALQGVSTEQRLKIIFLGNSTAGKSTLRRILISPNGKETVATEKNKPEDEREPSTHGVKLFQAVYWIKAEIGDDKDRPKLSWKLLDNESEIKSLESNGEFVVHLYGYDFGGQDYYHSTHLPFYSSLSLNILLFGNHEKLELHADPATQFDSKIIQQNHEVLYPLNYWIGSLQYCAPGEIQKMPEPSRIEIVQNVHSKYFLKSDSVSGGTHQNRKFELNNLALRSNSHIILGDIEDFNFHDEPTKVKKWLIERIYKYSQPYHLYNVVSAFDNNLQNQGEIIYDIKDLKDNPALSNLLKNQPGQRIELDSMLTSLEKGHMGFYVQCTANEFPNFYIANLEVFSDWIHRFVLSEDMIRMNKELNDKNKNIGNTGELNVDGIRRKGYFNKALIRSRIEKEATQKNNYFKGKIFGPDLVEKNIDRLLHFLLYKQIVFRVEDHTNEASAFEAITDETVFVAPAYLPKPVELAERLLLDSFNSPDCKFIFKGFFHSNIIQIIIANNRQNLVKDLNNPRYLLWKNKIVLYQQSRNTGSESKEWNEKAFLLIQLQYPGFDGFKGVFPELTISRNQSDFVKDSIFGTLFKSIKKQLALPEEDIEVKTRFGAYIPYHAIKQENKDEKHKHIDMVYYEKVMYSVHDFRHFREEKLTEPTKIFIAYSRFDIDYVEELLVHLKPYENRGEVIVFYDKRLNAGEKWDEETRHHLSTSDVVVCMVSPPMLGTPVVIDVEIPLAVDEGIPIAPVLLRSCDWQNLNLSIEGNILAQYNFDSKALVMPGDRYSREPRWEAFARQLKEKYPRLDKNDKQEQQQKDEPPPRLKVFIAYSAEEQAYLDEFLLHLKPYEDKGDIKLLIDKGFMANDKLHEEKEKRIQEADVFVCLLTPRLMGIKSVVEHEFKLAVKESIPFAPIPLLACNWEYLLQQDGEKTTIAFPFETEMKNVMPPDRYSREFRWSMYAKYLSELQAREK